MDDQRDARGPEAGGLKIADLEEQDLLQAYALIRLHESALSLGAWRCRVLRDREHRSAHWAVVRDLRGYMHAVFRYAVNECSIQGRRSVVTNIYAAGLARRYAVTAINSWISKVPEAPREHEVLPSGWILISANTSRY